MINIENIKKDFYYSQLFNEHGETYVINAGYFENETQDNCMSDEELKETLKFPCTPLKSIDEYDRKNPCVILSTGCFNPVHSSHLAMVKYAKFDLMCRGYNVIQTFLSPDSDTYCATKGQHYSFSERVSKIKQLREKLGDDIDIDQFPLVINKDLNFTTIYRRLELYIEKYIGKKIPIFYVCGSDRSQFSHTFGNKAIVIKRWGYELKDIHPEAIFYNPPSELYHSSTEMRKLGINSSKKKEVIIRQTPYEESFPLHIFEKYFSKVHVHNFKIDLPENTISLDSLTRTKYNLKISRLFNLGGVDKMGFTNRKFSEPLLKQIERFPKGDYWLFDDDIHTGNTMKFAKDFLELNGFNIIGYKSLLNSNLEHEILDARDFVFGGNSGLCVRFPDSENYRVPYLFPFVDLYQRASILKPIEFSEEMWNWLADHKILNLFKINKSLFGEVYIKLGFSPETTFREVAKYYANICKNARITSEN